MCAGKLQAIFCRFDKGERGQIPGHQASGRALYGRRAFVHCQLPLEWHAPIASVAALIERLAGCRFGGTPADRTRHCRGAACRSRRGAADWLQAGVKTVKTKGLSLRGRAAPVAISGRQLRFCRKYPIIRPGTARFPCRFVPRNDTSRRCGGASVLLRG